MRLTLQHPGDEKQRYIAFFEEVVQRTARLVAHWQCVGFVHGVLNTGKPLFPEQSVHNYVFTE